MGIPLPSSSHLFFLSGMFTAFRFDEEKTPWCFPYKMTVPTYIDMVLFVIENGFAICERCKGLRSFVFQIPLFTLFNECNSSTAGAFDPSSGIFNECSSSAGVGDLIAY